MPQFKRRHFLQSTGSLLAALGLSQLDIQRRGNDYGRVLAQNTRRKLALLVGINQYGGGIPSLGGCVNDTDLQKQLLINKFAFDPKDILIVNDAQATRQGILTAFEQHLIQQAKPDDVVVFHFSGHGSQVVDPDRDSPDGFNSTFLPVDSRLASRFSDKGGVVNDIMGHTLFLLMSALQTENVTAVLDCCHAGGGTRGNFAVRSSGANSVQASPEEFEYQRKWLSQLNISHQEFIRWRKAGIAKGVVIAGAKRDQFAADATFDKFKAGAFTYLLTQYLWQQTSNEPLSTVMVNVGRSLKQLAGQQRNAQELQFEVKLNSANDKRPVYLVDQPTPPAEAVIVGVEGDRAQVWLGGVNQESLKAFEKGAVLNLNRHKDALQAYQQALAIKKEFDDRRGQATLLNNIGTAYRNLSEYNEALKVYQQALTLFKSVLDKSGEGTTQNNIGGVYNNLGQYSQALSVYKQALELLQSVNDKAGEGTTRNNIGVLYRNLGQYDEALKYYLQALEIINKLGKRALIATTLNNIGDIYDSKGKYEEALSKYQQALNIRKQLQDKAGEGTTLNSIGAAYRNLHQYQEALKVYQQALVIRKEVGDERGKATTLNNMGNVYLDLLQPAEALKLYQAALLISEKVGDKPDIGTTLSNIGSAYLQGKNLEQAIATLSEALDVLDSLRSSDLIDADKVALFETQDYTYRLLQKALVTQNKIKKALEIAERGRARAFVELFSKRVSSTSNTKPTISPPTIKQIQQIAQAQKATLVEYSIISEQELLIWVIQPTGEINVRQVDLKSLNTSLQDFVVTSRTFIGARGRGGSIGVVASPNYSPTQRLQKLHQILIEPITDFLPTNPEARVIFLPHKSLFLIPFVALKDVKGKYLIEKHTILTAPAIQVLDLTRKQRQQVSGKGTLIVGNPIIEPQVRREYNLAQLEGAEQEAIKIAQIFHTKALIGNQPTKAAILQRMPSARIIHLATHGLLDDVKKLGIPGAIVLAPDGKDNGLLTSEEILKLKLNAELVVLSACNTGQGNVTGDGVIGLSRSLIISGAPSVIVTLWKIPDVPSALLMKEFYQNLERDSDKATALRSAMLTTMKKHPNPIDWAAFTLIGEAE